jgi:hypothetical protein
MRIITFAAIAAAIAAPAAVLGAVMSPTAPDMAPPAPAAVSHPVAAPDPIQQDAPTWRVSAPPPPPPSPEPEWLDQYPWQVATSAGCAYVAGFGRYAPYATIDAIASDGVRVDILIDTPEFIMIGDRSKSPHPVMVFWRAGPTCDEIRTRMAANHARH